MSSDEETKFVITHVIDDVWNKEHGKRYYGMEKNRFGCCWKTYFTKNAQNTLFAHFECKPLHGNKNLSVEADVEMKRFLKTGTESFSFECVSSDSDVYMWSKGVPALDLINDNLKMECHVKIKKVTEIVREILKSFDDESAKESSDVVLIVKDRKFYVTKINLASHSSYFKSLFAANVNESGKSEIVLNGIDPSDFQNFLELIHGESPVDDDTVFGILKLADMYDSKSAIRRCEGFLVHKSERSLEEKFEIAIKYKMEKLKKKCLSKMKTVNDVWSIVPEDANELDPSTWKELLRLTISLE